MAKGMRRGLEDSERLFRLDGLTTLFRRGLMLFHVPTYPSKLRASIPPQVRPLLALGALPNISHCSGFFNPGLSVATLYDSQPSQEHPERRS